MQDHHQRSRVKMAADLWVTVGFPKADGSGYGDYHVYFYYHNNMTDFLRTWTCMIVAAEGVTFFLFFPRR